MSDVETNPFLEFFFPSGPRVPAAPVAAADERAHLARLRAAIAAGAAAFAADRDAALYEDGDAEDAFECDDKE